MRLLNSRFDDKLGREIILVEDQGRIKIMYKKSNTSTTISTLELPLSVHINITNRCNLNCTHCYAGKYINKQEESSVEKYIYEIIDKLYINRIFILEWSGGEPFIYENFCNVLEYADNLNFYQSILTNGVLLNDEILVKRLSKLNLSLEVSVDGDQNAVDYIKGEGIYGQIRSGIASAIDAGIPTIAKITILEENIGTYEKIIQDMMKLSVRT
ncbi:MAG: radical SAM protein, partial [Lutisporaceae bacterium]